MSDDKRYVDHDSYRGPDRRELPKEQWHLTKGVPIGIILALLVQTGSMLWGAATLKAEFESHVELADKNFEQVEETAEEGYLRTEATLDFALRDQRIVYIEQAMITMVAKMDTLQTQTHNTLRAIENKVNEIEFNQFGKR